MFSPFFLYLRPVAPFFSLHIVSFAIGLRPPPLLSTSRLLSRFKCYIHSLLSSLITGSPSHTTPRALSPVRLSLSTFAFAFPLSLCVAYIVSLRSRIRINTPHWPRRKGGKSAHVPLSSLCAFPGNRGPSYLVSSPFLCFFVTLARPTRSHLLPLATAVREPVRSAQLTISSPSHLDRRPITHTCGSGNNKPRTLLPVTLTRVPSSGTSLGYYFYIAHF